MPIARAKIVLPAPESRTAKIVSPAPPVSVKGAFLYVRQLSTGSNTVQLEYAPLYLHMCDGRSHQVMKQNTTPPSSWFDKLFAWYYDQVFWRSQLLIAACFAVAVILVLLVGVATER